MAVIKKKKNNKALGITGVTTDMLKNLPIAAINPINVIKNTFT